VKANQISVRDMPIGSVGEELRARGANLVMQQGVATLTNSDGKNRIVPEELTLPFCRGLLQLLRDMDDGG
jgi:hypothetical protein